MAHSLPLTFIAEGLLPWERGLLHTYISLPDLESSQLDKVFKSYLPPVEHCNLAHAQSDLRSIFCDALSEHV